MKELREVIFAGSGHGAVVAIKSLQEFFDKIYLVTDDEYLLSILRNNDISINSINDSDINLVVCAGYKKIIPKDTLSQKTIINTHPSLLPKYRGLHGLAWAMLNHEEELGFTIHLMDEKIDNGDILEQYRVKYTDQTSQEIMALFDKYVLENLGRVVKEYLRGEIQPIKQDTSKATWVCKRNLDDCIINFNWSNKYIYKLFKVLVPPYPRPIIKISNNLLEVTKFELIDIKYHMHSGRVVNIDGDDVYIKTEDGLLIIKELVDYNSKNRVIPSSILKLGYRL